MTVAAVLVQMIPLVARGIVACCYTVTACVVGVIAAECAAAVPCIVGCCVLSFVIACVGAIVVQ